MAKPLPVTSDTRGNHAPWYKLAFREDYLERYAHRNEAHARAAAPFLIQQLDLQPGQAVLDLCCGEGRFMRALADHPEFQGRLFGLDLSEDLVRHARAQRPDLLIARGDMRCLPFATDCLHGVVNLFTSFGYFENPADDARVLVEVARVLAPGGRFIQDFLNRDHALAGLEPRTERETPLGLVVETRRYDPATGRIEKQVQVRPAADSPEAEPQALLESVRAYSPEELEGLHHAAGLTVLGRYGDLDGQPFEPARSPRCVLVSAKECA